MCNWEISYAFTIRNSETKICQFQNSSSLPKYLEQIIWKINPLNASPTKWWNTLKQFVGNSWRIVWVCLTILWGWCFLNPSNLFEENQNDITQSCQMNIHMGFHMADHMRMADHITSDFLKAVFHKFYSVHSWILCFIWDAVILLIIN